MGPGPPFLVPTVPRGNGCLARVMGQYWVCIPTEDRGNEGMPSHGGPWERDEESSHGHQDPRQEQPRALPALPAGDRLVRRHRPTGGPRLPVSGPARGHRRRHTARRGQGDRAHALHPKGHGRGHTGALPGRAEVSTSIWRCDMKRKQQDSFRADEQARQGLPVRDTRQARRTDRPR